MASGTPVEGPNNRTGGDALGSDLRRKFVVGTGGVGSGILMRLEGDHTLGRDESRAAVLLEGRDYCKLHIVLHYVQRLLGAGFPVIPIGRVGADRAGHRLLEEMAAIGMRLDHVKVVDDRPTLFAVAFSYPNGNGGNLTAVDSASDSVGLLDIRAAEAEIRSFPGAGIAVALPEVPLEARRELLLAATDVGLLRIASFVPGEAAEVLSARLLELVDIVMVNQDEAAMFTGIDGAICDELILRWIERFRHMNDQMSVVITAGSHGSWSWDSRSLQHAPALPAADVQNTAGAGDAHLAGIIVAETCGVRLHEANEFGALIGAMKVASKHTISPGITPQSVIAESVRRQIVLPELLRRTLQDIVDAGHQTVRGTPGAARRCPQS